MNDKLKILIVEDDKSLLILYDMIIPDAVFEKQLVRDGVAAMEAYYSWRPDIILLDIMLPKMTGYTMLKEIRGKMAERRTAIIIATSCDAEDEVMDCAKIGIQGYIVKPFDLKKLAEMILEYYSQVDAERADAARAQLSRSEDLTPI